MPSELCLVCVSQTPWEGVFQKPAVQLLTELAARHRVLYVDYPYTFKDVLLRPDGPRQPPLRRMLGLSDRLRTVTTPATREVHVWTPPILVPTNWMPDSLHDTWLNVNAARLARSLQRTLRHLGMSRPVIINAFHPTLGLALVGRLNEQATLYYCFDEISAEPWMGRHGSRYEQQYLRQVDAVVTTSVTLCADKKRLQPHAYVVKNGANVELFQQAYTLRAQVQPTAKTVGYLGTVDNRLDVSLLIQAVERLPDVRFQFLGRITDPTVPQRLAHFPNVEFSAPVPPADLPPLLATMHVGLIPFVRNEHTYTIYPLKINEYLAAGLPVVTTNFAPLDDFGDAITRADTPDTFVAALKTALAEIDPALAQRRIRMATDNSWPNRAAEFEDVIRETLRRKA